MKILFDACVLYPTVMRELLLGVADVGLYEPLWSARILEEWVRAAAKKGATDELMARSEIALCRARWPQAEVKENIGLEGELYLPDRNDRHVLAAAITGDTGTIVTMNLKDFPKRHLAEFSIRAVHPDEFLTEHLTAHSADVLGVSEKVRLEAERLSGQDWPMRKLMKKVRLPRFGKAMERLQ